MKDPDEAKALPRYQIKRGKRLPKGVLKVDRSTRWGNPFPVGAEAHTMFHMPHLIFRVAGLADIDADHALTRQDALKLYRAYLARLLIIPRHPDYYDLSYFDNATGVACWCSLDEECHADDLIKIIRLYQNGDLDDFVFESIMEGFFDE